MGDAVVPCGTVVIDGCKWQQGQTAAGVAERAKTRYGEFLDNVKAFAYFPYAVATGVDDFREGTISLRFKGISGRIDQCGHSLQSEAQWRLFDRAGQPTRKQFGALEIRERQTQLREVG
jgi:hypothetical protein